MADLKAWMEVDLTMASGREFQSEGAYGQKDDLESDKRPKGISKAQKLR